jgi:hypothetical protein
MRHADLHETPCALGFMQEFGSQFARLSQLTSQLSNGPLAIEGCEPLGEVFGCRRQFRGVVERGLRLVGTEAFRPPHRLAVVGLQLHAMACERYILRPTS